MIGDEMIKKLLLFASVSSFGSFAGDYYDTKAIGFSHNGHYFAYLSSSVDDGDSIYAQIDIIDVPKDSLVKRDSIRTGEGGQVPFECSYIAGDDERSVIENCLIARAGLSYYGIVPGQNLGLNLKLKTHSGALVNGYGDYGGNGYSSAVIGTGVADFQILVNSLAAKNTKRDDCRESFGNGMDLKVLPFNSEGKKEVEAVFSHKDYKLWGARASSCPYNYALKSALYHPESKGLVLMISYHSELGFEGPDTRHMAMTLQLD
jgi:hypothetical protein